MNIPFLIFSLLFFVFVLRYSYFWWFQGEKYVRMNKKERSKLRKTLFFMPQTLMFNFYDRDPQFEILINRIVSTLFVVATMIMVIVSIRGPF